MPINKGAGCKFSKETIKSKNNLRALYLVKLKRQNAVIINIMRSSFP